jgi:DNA polymerase-3 subunit delta
MENEIKKLVTYKNSITVADVKKIVTSEIETNIFNLVDALGQKNLKKALIEVKNMLKKGENEIYILSMIIYQMRNLILVKNILVNNQQPTTNNQQLISRKLALHPFVVKKTLLQVKNFTLEKLKEIYQKLVDFDIAVKTGKIEPGNALNLLIIEIVGGDQGRPYA